MKIFKTEEQKKKALTIAAKAGVIAIDALMCFVYVKIGMRLEQIENAKRNHKIYGDGITDIKVLNSKRKFDIYGEENGFVQELAVNNSVSLDSLEKYNSVTVVLMERDGEPDTWFEDVSV